MSICLQQQTHCRRLFQHLLYNQRVLKISVKKLETVCEIELHKVYELYESNLSRSVEIGYARQLTLW